MTLLPLGERAKTGFGIHPQGFFELSAIAAAIDSSTQNSKVVLESMTIKTSKVQIELAEGSVDGYFLVQFPVQ
uniref:Uncharacterized protein n=1 Tax=Solanum lycopersicum TaxID=4081 RepID=A0A3Q7EWZ6_SOLLC